MREIEVKARVRNIEELLKNAASLGIVFGEEISQKDTIYETTLPKGDPKWNIFRIRQQNGTTILNMKYKASSRRRDNHERESVVDNPKEVADMLERLGYMPSVNIRKHRRTAKYNDLELCIDVVDELGTFIEVEKLAADDADVDAVQSRLWNLLRKLGVEDPDRVTKGYDSLIHEAINTTGQ